MLYSYLVSAFRNLLKNKTIAAINLIALAIGLSGCFFMIVHLLGETSYDNFHQNRDRIYRVICKDKNSGQLGARTPFPLAKSLENEYLHAIKTVKIYKMDSPVYVRTPENFYKEEILLTEPSFFNVFSFLHQSLF
ncbi:ABC transporter permease [candidate division KSB1 bacterium]|nr:ABC transporter permease [candidate division KSB1 bacterium]